MYRVRVRTALISDRSDLGLAVGRLTASSGSAFSCGSVFVRGTRGGAVSPLVRNFAAVKAPRDSTARVRRFTCVRGSGGRRFAHTINVEIAS